jgi:hypothetical protein
LVKSSGDAVQDKTVKDAFVAGYGVMRRWRKMPDDSQILLVGADNFPFPIPRKKMMADIGSSIRLPARRRFCHAVSAAMN